MIRRLLHCTTPLSGLNITGPETVSINALATSIGRRMGRQVDFTGQGVPSICVVNCGRDTDLFGSPMVPLERIVTWVSDWVSRDMTNWNKHRHYDTLNDVY